MGLGKIIVSSISLKSLEIVVVGILSRSVLQPPYGSKFLSVEPVRTLPEHYEGKSANVFVDMFRDSAPYSRNTAAR